MGIGSALSRLVGFSAMAAAAPVPLPAPRVVVIDEAPRRKPIGGAGNLISAGFLSDLEHNADIRGALWRGEPGKAGTARKMMCDAHVRSSVDDVLNPMTSAVWRFGATSKSPIDVEIADACTWAFFEQLPWSQYLRRIGISYFSNGFALEEITDDIRPIPSRFRLHPGGGRGLVPTGFHQRPAWTVHRWWQSKTDPSQLDGIEQWLSGSDTEKTGFVTVPANRLLRFTWDQDGADFDGNAPLRSAYSAWRAKLSLMTIDMIAHERHGVGSPVAIAAANAADEDLDAAQEILAEMRAMEKQWALFPHDWQMDWKVGQSGTDLHQAMLRCNQDIAINLGSGHKMLGQVGPGSYAMAGVQEGTLHRTVDAHARFVATVLYGGTDGWSPVERFVRANYGDDVEIPKPRALYLPTKNWDAVSKTYSVLVQSGAMRRDAKTEDALREAMELPAYDEESAIGGVAATEAAADPDSPGQGSKDGGAPVANERLNGAQFTAIQGMLNAAALEQLPRDSVVAAFEYGLDLEPAKAERVVGSIGKGFVPKTTAAGAIDTAATPDEAKEGTRGVEVADADEAVGAESDT